MWVALKRAVGFISCLSTGRERQGICFLRDPPLASPAGNYIMPSSADSSCRLLWNGGTSAYTAHILGGCSPLGCRPSPASPWNKRDRTMLPVDQGVKGPDILTLGVPTAGGGSLLSLGAPSAGVVACDEGLAVARVLAVARELVMQLALVSSSAVASPCPYKYHRAELPLMVLCESLSSYHPETSRQLQIFLSVIREEPVKPSCCVRSWWSDQCRRSISECAGVFNSISGRVPFHGGMYFSFTACIFKITGVIYSINYK